jgi:hypothetical protein
MFVRTEARAMTTERLDELRAAFSATRGSGRAPAIPESIADLIATAWSYRHRWGDLLASLPDSAFAPQSPDTDGSPRWSAGQCVAHVVASQRMVFAPALAALTRLGGPERFVQPQPGPVPSLLSREGARAILTDANDELRRLCDGIPDDVDLTCTLDHAFFGTIDFRTLLLLLSLHERGHQRQAARWRPVTA